MERHGPLRDAETAAAVSTRAALASTEPVRLDRVSPTRFVSTSRGQRPRPTVPGAVRDRRPRRWDHRPDSGAAISTGERKTGWLGWREPASVGAPGGCRQCGRLGGKRRAGSRLYGADRHMIRCFPGSESTWRRVWSGRSRTGLSALSCAARRISGGRRGRRAVGSRRRLRPTPPLATEKRGAAGASRGPGAACLVVGGQSSTDSGRPSGAVGAGLSPSSNGYHDCLASRSAGSS